jgi:hypothetical protein
MKNYKKNIYSQNGEDGIIEFLLSKIPNDKWCCEFGAWDGKHLSNTFNLVEKKEYNAVYIESDSSKFQDLLKTKETYNRIVPVNKFIDMGANSLDNILSETQIPYDFDILSIDVDSTDYAIWDSLKKYKPKIVVIEINSSLDPDIILNEDELTIEKLSTRSGVNYRTCYNLGVDKGYTFLCHTGNMIFVDQKYSSNFEEIPTEENLLTYFDNSWR